MAVSQDDATLDKGYLSKKVTRDQPVDWGDDDLSRHWDDCASNMVTNFTHGTNELRHMQAVDRLFMKIANNLINSKNVVVALLLLLRCHSAYRAATMLAVSGMPTDVYPLLRTVLETAGYALIIHRAPKLGSVWLERHTSDADKANAKKEFTVAKVKSAIEAVDARGLLKILNQLYETTIDFGGHPNERSLTSNLSLVEDDKTKTFNVQYIHGNTLAVRASMKVAAQAGLCALYTLQHTMKERFSILGLREEMNGLRQSGL